ncbi:alpha-glucuronidase [Cellulomonas sp. ATA003]|uniref:alpha-glucuronidase n=1 Tax=Cellulomonas sp. ATA003 TaxID=3073064 RepID=UPI00287356CB|nr:alpha-glucuronidase [Cellulomonas sp. ATA003]WNB87413.1 alpha-glucuronidase [Cellulomonas sp. ATA003]
MTPDIDPCWLPARALASLGTRRVLVLAGDAPVAGAVTAEVATATSAHGGAQAAPGEHADVVLATLSGLASLPSGDPESADTVAAALVAARDAAEAEPLGPESFLTVRRDGVTVVLGGEGAGLLYGLHHLVRRGAAAGVAAGRTVPDAGEAAVERHAPAQPIRMLDHWDNIAADTPMGAVERGYAGASIFYADGRVREDLSRVEQYARLLASTGVNAVGLNNVNVHRREAELLTTALPDVARLAAVFRAQGIRVYLSVDFAAPITLAGMATSDPLDEGVQDWWARAAADVYAQIPDFGGFVVKADSEGRPGPFAYGRDHADGANMLARALAPFGGTVFWRAFVYDHRQDWRDRTTDRARAAYDHFAPLDGRFDPNVVVQVKNGPIDFQVREPISPVITAMPRTRLAVELQVTQEYTGQQKHVCYLGAQWEEYFGVRLWGDDRTLADVVGGVTAVSNVGDDAFWTGHPLAQANLYAFGRMAWDPTLGAGDVLDEWIALTFGSDEAVAATVRAVMADSWRTLELYTAPLGVGFMVRPNHHYGPDVDGYEYTPWGTYHFADRDGIGVDRTRATGTGYTGQYPAPWDDVYESLDTCPDEFLLFFHHVPYSHVLHSGSTVVQHIYDTHFAGVERVEEMARAWATLEGAVPDAVFARVTERLVEQRRSAVEWRDQINTYFLRKSGVPDAHGRRIF